MSEPEFPEPDVPVETIAPRALKERIDAGEDVVVLDTRAPGDVEEWSIDGPSVETINVPYYEFLVDDPDEELFEEIPADREVVAVCAKGQSSEYVAGLLDERGYDVSHLDDGMNGWARIYEATGVETDLDATLRQYRRPSSGCLAYMLVSGDEAAVFDPLRAFSDRYVEDAADEGATVEYAVDTHVHADHVSGVRTLAAEAGAQAIVPEASAARGIEYDDYRTVADGDTIEVGDVAVDALHTPGHTSGMTSYPVGSVLMTGDGLFTESVARPDLEEGDEGAAEAAATLHGSLERILSLPDETVIAPAHFGDGADPAEDGTYTAELGDLIERMDALGMEREAFVEFVLADMPPRPANYGEIIDINLGRRDADDDRAFSLELGPNNCAATKAPVTSE